jgi:hypothetical protein
MAARQTSSRTLKSLAGAGIFALGLLLLFLNLDGVIAQISYAVGAPVQAPQILPALGLVGLHAVQAYTLDQAGFLPSLEQMLVSFWPMILIAIGAALLRGSFSRRLAESEVVAAYSGRRTSL